MENNNNIVTINFDKPRNFRYAHKALKTIKALTGKSVFGLDIGQLDPDEIEKIAYAGLLSDDPNLKLEEMEDILDKANYLDVINAITKAFDVSFGVDEKNVLAETVAEK